MEEPLLNDKKRTSMLPIEYPKIWKWYKKMQAANWTAEEVDFSNDYNDFITLKPEEQHFIKMVLCFFSASDIIVNINLAENFIREVQVLEAVVAYQFQAAIENVHSECYSLMIDNIIKDPIEKNKAFNAVSEYECIKNKAAWAVKWIQNNDNVSFGQRLIAFSIVEGIFFSGSFCAIFWFKKKGLMDGLCISNEFIARDEGMHTDGACLLYSYIKNRVPEKIVHEMFIEAVNIEVEFICESLPCSLIGMNSSLMTTYIKYIADRLLVQLNYSKIWNINECPFDFMESISLEGKTNFFEKVPTQYQNANILNTGKENSFVYTEDF